MRISSRFLKGAREKRKGTSTKRNIHLRPVSSGRSDGDDEKRMGAEEIYKKEGNVRRVRVWTGLDGSAQTRKN